jgi:hypothetical protein
VHNDEWGDNLKIFDLDWSQYDCFCHEYQRDKPASAVPIGDKQPMDSIARWDKDVR